MWICCINISVDSFLPFGKHDSAFDVQLLTRYRWKKIMDSWIWNSGFFRFLNQIRNLHFSTQLIYYLAQLMLSGIVCFYFKATKHDDLKKNLLVYKTSNAQRCYSSSDFCSAGQSRSWFEISVVLTQLNFRIIWMKATLCFLRVKHGKDMGKLFGVDDRTLEGVTCNLVAKLMINHRIIVSLPKGARLLVFGFSFCLFFFFSVCVWFWSGFFFFLVVFQFLGFFFGFLRGFFW